MKPVNPVYNGQHSAAIAISTYNSYGPPQVYDFKLADMGLSGSRFDVLDLFNDAKVLYSNVDTNEKLTVTVHMSGCVMLKAVPRVWNVENILVQHYLHF